MLATLYNTGAWVSEPIGLKLGNAVLESSACVHLHGKGRKQRTVPLWRTTASQLRQWLRYYRGAADQSLAGCGPCRAKGYQPQSGPSLPAPPQGYASSGRSQQRLHRVAPRVTGSTRLLRSTARVGSWDAFFLRHCPANTPGRSRNAVTNVGKSMINRRPRHSADPGHQTDPAPSQRSRFQGYKSPTALFIQNRCHLPIAPPCGACLRSSNHPVTLRPMIRACESRSRNSSCSVVIVTQLFMDGPLAVLLSSRVAGTR